MSMRRGVQFFGRLISAGPCHMKENILAITHYTICSTCMEQISRSFFDSIDDLKWAKGNTVIVEYALSCF